MANTTNISPIISPDILKTLSVSTAVKAFGAQTKDKNKELVIIGNQTKTADLDNELDLLTQKEQQAGVNKDNTIQKAQSDFNTKQITQEQYNAVVISAEFSYQAEVDIINVQRQKIQQDKDNIVNDPNKKIKDQQKIYDTKIKNSKKDTQNKETKSKKDLTKQVVSNAVKTLAPIIALQLSNAVSILILQRKKLEVLVDQVNNYIDTQVKDQATVTIATNLRNNAITLINNNIKKLESLGKILKTINTIIAIFSLILKILSLIPFPVPPKVVTVLVKAEKLVSAISALVVIATILLANEILRLIELRERLKQISLKLDGKALLNLNEQQLTDLTNEFLPAGGNYGSYKGFKFAIKEEKNQNFVVKGNKRRYAVAIDRYGVEIVKSEYSFTLDPNDLIEQLKLTIDSSNIVG